MAGKVVTTAAPTKQETAAAKSYVGSTRASQGSGLNVRETAGSDASKVNYYKGSAAHSAATSSAAHQQYMDTVRTRASRDELFGPLRDAASYLSSGQTNSQTSSEWLKIANDNAANNQDEEVRGYWSQMANEFRSALASDYSRELGGYKEQLSKLQDEDKTLSGNLKNTSRSVEAGMYDTAMLKAYDDGIKQRANNRTQQAELSAKIAEIENTIFDTLATDEVKEARARLTKDKYDAEWGYLAPGEAVTQRDLDQQLVDQFMESIGQQTQYYNFADRANAVLTRFSENLAGSAGNLAALGLSEADFYNSLPEDMRALVSDPEAMSKATPEQLAQIQAYREQFDANTGNGGRLAAMTDKAEAWADQHDQQAAEEIRKAKQGLSKFGQFGVDMASTALDIGFDAATGLGLGSMFARVAGQGIGEARRAGATSDQQIAYGLSQAAIEVLTEKMSDGLGIVYGKGVATDIVEDVIKKLGVSSSGANLIRLLAGAVGEGGEEVVSDLLNPFTQWIIDQNARDNRTYEIDPSELLHDFLLGSAMGLLGSTAEAVTGGYAQKNAELGLYRAGRATESGDGVHSRLTADDSARNVDDRGNELNRTRKITDRLARVAEKLGYGNKSDQGEAYKTATGKTIEEANAEADAESWAASHPDTTVPGGDAAPENYFNMSRDQVVDLWRNNKLTDAQLGEVMKENFGWTEEDVRQHLARAKQLGADAEQRRRDTLQPNSATPVGETFERQGKFKLPDTEETVKSESARIYKEIEENDNHIDEDHRPRGGGVLYWTKSTSKESIQKIWERQAARLKDGEKMTRDAEFETYTDDSGRKLTLQEAAEAEEDGETVYRWRAIDQHVIDDMVRATPEEPFVVGGRFGSNYKFFVFDGTRLRIVKSTEHSENGGITVNSDNTLPAGKFETAAVYLTECLSNQFSGKSAYSIWSGGHDINGNKKNNDKYLRYITGLNARQENGTIEEQKGADENEKATETANSLVQSEGANGSGSNPQQSARSFQPGKTGRNPLADKQYISCTPLFTGENAKELTEVWTLCAKHAEQAGGHVLTEDEVSALPKEIQNVRRAIEDYFGIPMTYAKDCVTPGFTYKSGEAQGLFVDPDNPKFPVVVAHELAHILWKRKDDYNRASIAKTALTKSDLSNDAVNDILGNALHLWGSTYIPGFDTIGWRMLRPDQQLKVLQSQPDSEEIIDRLYEELSNVFFTNDLSLAPRSMSSYLDAPNIFVRSLIDNGIATEEDISIINKTLKPFSFQLPSPVEQSDLKLQTPDVKANVEGSENYSYYADSNLADSSDQEGSQETPQNAPETQAAEEGTPVAPEEEKTVKPQEESVEQPTEPKARTPVAAGTVKESKSSALKQQATRGEERNVRNTENTTFVSKTNADRSEIADHIVGDTDASLTDAVNNLLSKDERWDDQDVVTAERAMYKMVRAIRDFQLGNKRKLSRSAFKALTERYNKLTARHIEEKSKAGQELQAEYQFTPAEKIMDRMAKTFLGFAKDGTFAGATDSAVNAKVYAAAEDASNRITEAVEAKDAEALAQICKDISDIRGVKKMFGPFTKFASKVENSILNSIAKQENGIEALETLALGNLNAICDDVQPYKALNAAKTIRIMNMLSNMSTIVNNVTNNIASGMTSTNALSQWASDKAANAFRKLTGEPVLAKAQQGWIAREAIRNAEWEALQMATLVQMYGVNQESGKLELKGDKGLFNPNANMFEQTMALYKFFVGMGVEATDQVKSAGLQKAMQKGIDDLQKAGKITETQKAEMEREAKHEVDRLLYKDDSKFANSVQYIRNRLNDVKTWGNDDVGTIGLGDISMAFAKVPANVVRARLLATPEGCLYQIGRYVNGVQKAKRMHSEVLARGIMEKYAAEKAKLNDELTAAYDQNWKETGYEEKQNKINEIKHKIDALDRNCWNEARAQCSGGVYNRLVKERDKYGQNLSFEQAVQRCKYNEAKEMSQFDAAQYSRAIGKAASSAGMIVVGAALRGLGALRDFDNEPDEELRKMYAQKGYKGLMLNLSAIGRKNHEWRDGDNVLSADFLEVIALPLAIGACATDSAILAEKGDKTKSFFKEIGLEGLGKAFEAAEDIPGMADAIGFYNAFNNQFNSDNAANGSKLANSLITYAANSIPSFFIPNAFTQAAAGLDNTMRDVYTTDNVWQQAWNIVKNKGGLAIRRTIPASVDMWGNERQYGENKFWGVVNKTLLPGDRIKYRQNKYESEIIRLTKEGYKGATPKLSVSGSFEVDGETYTMDADEKRAFKQNRNTEQAEVYRQFMDSPEYDMLTDDQKVAVLKDLKMDCERDAKQTMLSDRGLDTQVTRAKWETELPTTKEQITYLSMKQIAGAAWDSEENRVSDYAAMDSFLKDHYGDMTKEMRDILDGSISQLDKMYDASKAGINSEMWQKAYDIYRQYNSDEGEAAVDGGFKDWEATEMWTKIEKTTGANSRQMNWFEENMGLMRHMRVDPEHYQDLTDKLGWSRESASNLTKSMSELQPSNGNKTVSYKQRLRCIAESKGTTDDQKWEAFYEYCPSSYTKIIKGMTNLRNRGYTYEQALKTYKSGKNSMWWVYENEK